jgi:hypothetical protein
MSSSSPIHLPLLFSKASYLPVMKRFTPIFLFSAASFAIPLERLGSHDAVTVDRLGGLHFSHHHSKEEHLEHMIHKDHHHHHHQYSLQKEHHKDRLHTADHVKDSHLPHHNLQEPHIEGHYYKGHHDIDRHSHFGAQHPAGKHLEHYIEDHHDGHNEEHHFRDQHNDEHHIKDHPLFHDEHYYDHYYRDHHADLGHHDYHHYDSIHPDHDEYWYDDHHYYDDSDLLDEYSDDLYHLSAADLDWSDLHAHHQEVHLEEGSDGELRNLSHHGKINHDEHHPPPHRHHAMHWDLKSNH